MSGGWPSDKILNAQKKEAGLFWDADCTWSNQHESPIRSVAFVHHGHAAAAAAVAPAGDWLVSCDAVSMIRIFNIENRELIHTIHGGEAPIGPIYLVKKALSLLSSSAVASSAEGAGGGEVEAEGKPPVGAARSIMTTKKATTTIKKKKKEKGTTTAVNPQWTSTLYPFLITHTRRDVLVWHAKTGQVSHRCLD